VRSSCWIRVSKTSFTRSDYRRTKQWKTGKHRRIHTTRSFARPAAGYHPELSTTMPGRRPVGESTLVHVLLIDMFTHSGFYPAGQMTGLCEYAYAFLCSLLYPAIIRTCRPVENRDVRTKFQVVPPPVRLAPSRSKTGTCERGLTELTTIGL
jgi:hypothetical protein